MQNITRLVPLLVAAGILLAGNGLQGTLITLRAAEEGFDTTLIGVMGAAYFFGFLLSCLRAPHLIAAVGHIRVFTAFAALSAVSCLLLILVLDPLVWIAIRFIAGFCFSGLFMVIESWLNEQSGNADRGRVMSIYRMIDLTAVTGSQFLIPVFGIGGFEIFAVTAIIFCLSLVPVALSDRSRPTPPAAFRFDLATIWRISPMACMGTVSIGMTNGAFRMIGPLFGREAGLDTAGVAAFMSAGILGGAVMQFPLGYLSDRVDRRFAILAATAGAVAAGLFLARAGGDQWLIYAGAFAFGACAMPLYSLSAAVANDRAGDGQYVLIAAGLTFFYSIGAIIGPFIASVVIDTYSASAFFLYTSAVHAALIVLTVVRLLARPTVPRESRSRFVGLLRTSPAIFGLARKPRGKAQEKVDLRS